MIPSTGNKKNNFQNYFQIMSSIDEAHHRGRQPLWNWEIVKELRMRESRCLSEQWKDSRWTQVHFSLKINQMVFAFTKANAAHVWSLYPSWDTELEILAPLFLQVSKLRGEWYYCYSKWLHKQKKQCICNYSLQQDPALHHDLYLKENSDLLLVDSPWIIEIFKIVIPNPRPIQLNLENF